MVRRQIARLRSRKGVRPFLDRSTHLNWIAHSAQASEGRIVQTRPAVLVVRKRRAQLHVTFVASGTGGQGHAIRKKSDTAVEPTPARQKSRDGMKRARGSIDRALQGSMVAHSCNRAQAAVGLCRVQASRAHRKTTREFSRNPRSMPSFLGSGGGRRSWGEPRHPRRFFRQSPCSSTSLLCRASAPPGESGRRPDARCGYGTLSTHCADNRRHLRARSTRGRPARGP